MSKTPTPNVTNLYPQLFSMFITMEKEKKPCPVTSSNLIVFLRRLLLLQRTASEKLLPILSWEQKHIYYSEFHRRLAKALKV